jgi:hypothetical protein
MIRTVVRPGALALCLAAAASSVACREKAPPPDRGTAAPVSFVNKVWRVQSSSSIETGMLYVFLSDGTLVISSPHGTPSLGTWKPSGTGFTMIEEGRPYPVDVLKLSADEFRIMINNPGDAVEIAFVPAANDPARSPD